MDWTGPLLAVLILTPRPAVQGTHGSLHVTGQVARADGSAWSDATIVLHSLPWRLPDQPPFLDRVETRSDPDGSFAVELAPGRSYSVWAVSTVTDGRYTVSDVVGGVSAGRSVALRERAEAQRVVRVGVGGLEAWGAGAPFSCEVLCLLDNCVVLPCGLDEAGLAVVPPVPVETVLFRVRSSAGLELASTSIPVGEERRAALVLEAHGSAASGSTSARVLEPVTLSESRTDLAVPAPVALRLELAGPKGPVQGARILWAERSDRRPIAETTRRGVAELHVPALWSERGEPFLGRVSFWIEGPGLASVHWWGEDLACRDEQGEPVAVPLSLPKGSSIEGRLSWSRGRPAAAVPVLVHTGVPSGQQFEGVRASFDGAPLVTWTDERGGFEVEGLSPHVAWQLSAFLPSDGVGDLAGSADRPLAPWVVLAAGEDASASTRKLGNLVLSTYRPLDVTVSARDGRPVAGLVVSYREALEATLQEERVAETRTDADGRIRLLARPGATLLLSLQDEAGNPREATARVDVRTGKQPLEVPLIVPDR